MRSPRALRCCVAAPPYLVPDTNPSRLLRIQMLPDPKWVSDTGFLPMKLAFIGGGNMARAIVGGLVSKGVARAADIVVVEIDAVARLKLISEFGVRAIEKPGPEPRQVDIVLFALKPPQMRQAAAAAPPHLL